MSIEITFGPRVRKSPFFDRTIAAGVSQFTIYNHMYLPIGFGDPAAEYQRLLQGVAMWDVAAERQVEICGPNAERLVRYLTPRDLGQISVGKGRYVPLCDHQGNIINDPVLLPLASDHFWLSIADSDVLLWVRAIAAERGYDVRVCEPDVSPLAIQGPRAEDVVADLFGAWVRDLKYFWFEQTELEGIPVVVARSGWSKQGGFEIYLRDGSHGDALWDLVAAAGEAYDIGVGAPNFIERIESGLLSFGSDNLPDSDPFEVGLGKLVSLDREDDFVGKAALIRRAADGPQRQLVGVVFDGPPVKPNQHPWPAWVKGQMVGAVRVVCHSPRRGNIGLALLATGHASIGTVIDFEGEGQIFKGEIVEMPLVRPGTPLGQDAGQRVMAPFMAAEMEIAESLPTLL
jgi:aminomethyltransferase